MLSEILYARELTSLMSAPGAVAAAPPRRPSPAETPVSGQAAVKRWLALHDQAVRLQAAWNTEACRLPRVVWRGIRSLFLYEHELTPDTRWRARTALWLRKHDAPLPGLVPLHRWERCRCPKCQPQLHQSSNAPRFVLVVA